tara:strand:- start:86 stop:847 length:762 start_codon:yes stop_codon:yes gene_type:complete
MLDAIVAEAQEYNSDLSLKAPLVRDYDQMVAVDAVLPASTEAIGLRALAEPLLLKKLEVDQRAKMVWWRLKALVGSAGAIDGVVKVTVTEPRRTFDKRRLKAEHAALYAQYCVKPTHRCSFNLLKKPTVAALPELKREVALLADAVPEIAIEDVRTDQVMPRDARIEALHAEWLELEVQKSLIGRDLQQIELDIRHLCGANSGIEGVCSYKRTESMEFDADAFKGDHPTLFSQFQSVGQPSHKIELLRARSYA